MSRPHFVVQPYALSVLLEQRPELAGLGTLPMVHALAVSAA